MRSKASLFLIEMLIAVIVFSFSAAIATNVFAKSKQMSDNATTVSVAIVKAGSAAERFRSGVKEISSTYESGGRWYAVDYSGSVDGSVETGEISVTATDGEVVYSLPVARLAEVSP